MRKVCFVVMPFGDERKTPQAHQLSTELYEHIKTVVVEAGFNCLRADEISRPGNIIADVVRHLATADVVIAEMTGQNANVFYELGVRHALSTSTILLAQSDEDIPFDLRPYRTIVYSFTPRGAERLATQLQAFLGQLLENPAFADNPVHEYLASSATRGLPDRGDKKFKQTEALEREVEVVKRQNFELTEALEELREVVVGHYKGDGDVNPSDLVGTWEEILFKAHGPAYLDVLDEYVVLAYEGRWPGCCWGVLDENVFVFSWSRFDNSLSGKGYYKLDGSLAALQGGIWFDGASVDLVVRTNAPMERHHLVKTSVSMDDKGRAVLTRAGGFLDARGVLGGA